MEDFTQRHPLLSTICKTSDDGCSDFTSISDQVAGKEENKLWESTEDSRPNPKDLPQFNKMKFYAENYEKIATPDQSLGEIIQIKSRFREESDYSDFKNAATDRSASTPLPKESSSFGISGIYIKWYIYVYICLHIYILQAALNGSKTILEKNKNTEILQIWVFLKYTN